MIISSINSGLTIKNVQLMRVFVLTLAIYFLIPIVIKSPQHLKQFTWFIIAFGTFTSVILLLRYREGMEYALGAAARPTYLAAGLSLGLLMTVKSGSKRTLYLSLFLFNLYAIIIEAQRRPVILVLVILIGFLVTKRISFRSFVLVAVAAFIITLIIPVIPDYTLIRYTEVFQPGFTGSGRTYIWASAVEVIKHNFLLGIGPGELPGAIYRPAHNMYIGTLAEVGIFGFIILLVIIIVTIFQFVKSRAILKKCNESVLLDLAFSWEMIFYGWLAMWFFTATLPTTRFFWVIIGISTALKAISSNWKSNNKNISSNNL